MGDEEPAEESRVRRLLSRSRSRVSDSSGKQRLTALAGVLLLLTAPFGGLHKAPPPTLEKLRTGKAYDVGPFAITVKKIVTFDKLEVAGGVEAEPSRPGGRIFVISAVVKNVTDEPQFTSLLSTAFGGKRTGVVPAVGDTSPKAVVYAVADGSTVGRINPGLTYPVAIVFEQEAGWKPGPVKLVLNDFTFVEDDTYSLDPNRWIADEPLASAELPVDVK